MAEATADEAVDLDELLERCALALGTEGSAGDHRAALRGLSRGLASFRARRAAWQEEMRRHLKTRRAQSG